MKKLVCGVGVFDEGTYKGWSNGSATQEYVTWNSMLNRACSQREKLRNKTYESCTVDVRFLSFQYFAEWANDQVGFSVEGYDLDKDILVKGNKEYCPDLCVFVPRHINTFLLKREISRGEYPIGVHFHTGSNRFMARCWVEGKRKYLGSFVSCEDAFVAYKTAKEAEAVRLANLYADVVDKRVMSALLNFKVDRGD